MYRLVHVTTHITSSGPNNYVGKERAREIILIWREREAERKRQRAITVLICID